MDNPENLSALGTQVIGRRQTKQKTQHRKLKKLTTRIPPKPMGPRMASRLCYFRIKNYPQKAFLIQTKASCYKAL